MILYEWLLGQGKPVRAADILRLGPTPLRSKGRRDAAIDRLVESGLIEVRGGAVWIAPPEPGPANFANPAKSRS